MRRKIHVVYITGAGRSGSTLLDRILGSVPGACSCGELQRFWNVLRDPEHRCSCGTALQACQFWQAILRHGFGELSEEEADEYKRLHLRMTQSRSLPLLSSPIKPASFLRDLRRYQELVRHMYSAITEVTGANTVIDSSKGAGYGWILPSVRGIRLSVINLVRDSRAVTNSWINHRPWNSRPFYLSTPSFSAMHWDLEHILAESLRLRADDYIRIRYEDFARAPSDALQWISAALAIEAPPVSVGGVIQQTDAHQVAGNRTRHSSGPVAIREDELWKQELGLVDAVKVTALTWPLLLRHGYSIAYHKPNT